MTEEEKSLYAIEYRFGWRFIKAKTMVEALKIHEEKYFLDVMIHSAFKLVDTDGHLEYTVLKTIADTETRRHAPVVSSPRRRRFLRRRHRHRRR